MVVPMCTSSMVTSTPETSSSVESSNMVFGSTLVQKPARKMTEDRKSIETMAFVFVVTMSPMPKTSKITNVARIGSMDKHLQIFNRRDCVCPSGPPKNRAYADDDTTFLSGMQCVKSEIVKNL